MRILEDPGLIRIEVDEWPKMLAKLCEVGYILARDDTNRLNLWTPDGSRCVSNRGEQRDDCYWIDVCVIPDLGVYGLGDN